MTNREMEIRFNWTKALKECEGHGTRLSSAIEWGFYPQDLLVLCCLHEAGMFREEIEDLLEDCNFHTECEALNEGKYERCRQLIISDLKGE